MDLEESTKQLQELGLTEAEAKTYLKLLTKGKLTASQISKETGLNRSYLYKVLESLSLKKLIFSTIAEKVKRFYPAEPEKLKELLETKIHDLKVKARDVGKLIHLLRNYKIESSDSELSVEVYEGVEGIRWIINEFTKKLKRGDWVYSFGYEHLLEKTVGRFWWENMIKKKKKKGIGFKGVWKLHEHAKRVNKPLTKTRYVNVKELGNIEVAIHKDTVRIFLLGKDPKVILIRNKIVADGFKNYFDFLWKKAK